MFSPSSARSRNTAVLVAASSETHLICIRWGGGEPGGRSCCAHFPAEESEAPGCKRQATPPCPRCSLLSCLFKFWGEAGRTEFPGSQEGPGRRAWVWILLGLECCPSVRSEWRQGLRVGGQIYRSHSSPHAAPASNEILRQVEMIRLCQP